MMKKYYVTIERFGLHGFIVNARNETSAINKAVRRANEMKSLTLEGEAKISDYDVVDVEYLGFYLNKVFIPVDK